MKKEHIDILEAEKSIRWISRKRANQRIKTNRTSAASAKEAATKFDADANVRPVRQKRRKAKAKKGVTPKKKGKEKRAHEGCLGSRRRRRT